MLHCGLRAFTGNYQSGLDSEVGILAYLSFAQEIHLELAVKELLVVRKITKSGEANPLNNHFGFTFVGSSKAHIY